MPPRPPEAPRRPMPPQPPRPAQTPKKPNRNLDLNTDYGQTADQASFEGKERTLLDFVSSVNIPCCVHDSDPLQVLRHIALAKKHACTVGAHIAYPDPKHFGYEPMELSAEELEAWIVLQLGAFAGLCRANGIDFEHVRPHGALYAKMATDEDTAMAVAKAVRRYDPWMILISPLSPLNAKVQAEAKLQIADEVYLGKRIATDGTLAIDKFSDSLHPQGAIEQVRQLLMDGSVTAEDGKIIKVNAKTMHLSPKLQGNMMVAERINAMMSGKPTPLSMVAAGSSGWL